MITKNSKKCILFFLKRHGDLSKPLRSQLTDRLNILIFIALNSGKTKICSRKMENPETGQKVLGLDANFLYLHAIARSNPTSFFCRYKEEKDFRPDSCLKFGYQLYQCLSYVTFKENTFLQSCFNVGKEESVNTV